MSQRKKKEQKKIRLYKINDIDVYLRNLNVYVCKRVEKEGKRKCVYVFVCVCDIYREKEVYVCDIERERNVCV